MNKVNTKNWGTLTGNWARDICGNIRFYPHGGVPLETWRNNKELKPPYILPIDCNDESWSEGYKKYIREEVK